MKTKIFHSLNIFLIIIFILLIDFTFSKIIYKKDHCFNFQYFENGHYYDLRKNCNSKYRFKSGFPTVNFNTDNLGLRVGDQIKIKDKSKKNIFIFGDSFTFGVGLEYENTYAGILEKKMPEYNFYNFAVGSYSPTVHFHRLKQAINSGLTPDKIILFLDLTDVIDESKRWIFDKNLNLPIRPENRIKNKKKFYKENFKLTYDLINTMRYGLRVIKDKFKDQKLTIKTSIQGQFTYTKTEDLDKRFWKKNDFERGLNKINSNINKISKLAKRNNAKFYLTVYPWAETLFYGQKSYNWSNFANQICDINDCITIDAIPLFQKYALQNENWHSKLYFIGDEHFNKQGAKLLANTVLQKISK
jgi:lysophospholipase L1-like esterase